MLSKPQKRLLRVGVPVAVLAYFAPVLVAVFVIAGLIDVSRHKRWDLELLSRYFAGNGILTWLLAPLNILFDLVSYSRPYRLRLEDFPEQERAEIEDVLNLFKTRREEIIADLRQRMAGKKRGMLFYKWYGKNVDGAVPEFNADYRYVKTIGVSVFNSKEKTSLHFGPLRLTIRLLYNLSPKETENIFIEVNGEKHFWHDDPLFIFDDTIQHRSVNEEEGERFCVFVDVLRPSPLTGFQNVCVHVANALLSGVNHVFYKNWAMLTQKG
jgi:aspartyl/asparaginyl beta-hydroxylase (cupin superfamily)